MERDNRACMLSAGWKLLVLAQLTGHGWRRSGAGSSCRHFVPGLWRLAFGPDLWRRNSKEAAHTRLLMVLC